MPIYNALPPYQRVLFNPDYAAYTDYSAVDSLHDQLVALHMFGNEQSVKANWASVVTGKSIVNFINGCQFINSGAKAHRTTKSMLPDSNWLDMWMIHKQAITKEANPFREPYFYVLVPDNLEPTISQERLQRQFVNTLDKTINSPVLTEWGTTLWELGKEYQEIHKLPSGDCHNLLVYRVNLDLTIWANIISNALSTNNLTF